MNFVYQHPVNLWAQMQRDAEQVLNRISHIKKAEATKWMPSVDIQEQTEAYVLLADIPGVDPEKIEISVDKDVLIIKGERVAASEEVNLKRVERTFGQFQRRFTLPDNADTDNISATGEHGVLSVRIPKQATVEPRKISVHVE